MTVTQDEPMVTNYCRMCEAKAKHIEALEAALRSIASCESHHPGDVVAIARQALGETQ